MARIRYMLVLLMILTLISGCNVGEMFKTKQDEVLFDKISEVQQQIEKEEWNAALSNIKEFEEKYKQRKWKLQLLGELEDYQDIELEVILFKEYVKDEDKVESLLRLNQIKYRLSVIFNNL